MGERRLHEAWATDEDLAAALERLTSGIPGFVMPAAYGLARMDADALTFGHVNGLGAVRPLPAVVLASVCGYTDSTGVYPMDRCQLATAVDRLSPAEAATHMPHPNLWSWRDLLERAEPQQYTAFFVADVHDPLVNDLDARFRQMI
jgi:hypothetical protein